MLFALVQVPAPTPPPADFVSFFQSVLEAITKKNWWLLVSLALIGLTWFTRAMVPKLGSGKFGAWLNTDRGGAVLVLFYAVLTSAAATLAAWTKPDINLLVMAIVTAIGAAGGFNLIKKIFFSPTPALQTAEKKAEDAEVVDLKKPTPPVPPALPPAALLPFALAAMLFTGCMCSKPENAGSPGCRVWNVIVSCGGQAILQGFEALVLAVLPAVSGTTIDWGALASLEEKYGTDAVACALAEAGLQASKGVAGARKLGPDEQLRIKKNVAAVLAARHVVVRS